MKGRCLQIFLWNGIVYKTSFEMACFTKFSLIGHFIQNCLWKGVVYRVFLKGICIQNFLRKALYTKSNVKVPLYGRKFTFVHFHAVCCDILHVENRAISKQYFYAKLGSKKARNVLQVWGRVASWGKGQRMGGERD